jgi:periplasmic protein CpxP/Spy
MKLRFLAALAVASLSLAVALVASAQSDPPAVSQALSGLPSPDEVVNRLSDKLALSSDQRTAIAPIIADRQRKLKDLAADSASRPRQRRSQMRSIIEQGDQKINAILTPDQQKQYAALEKQMREELRGRIKQQRQ